MSFFDRLMNSKLNAFADWFGRLIVINVMIIFFSLPILKIKQINLFKVSLVVAGKFYFTSVALIVLTVAPILLILSPITSLILVFMGVSVPLTVNVLITRNAVAYIEGLGEKDD